MSKREVMEATCDAFRKNGYADLSIQKIADEHGSGKSLIYYHFDDKEDLIESFLDFLINEINDYMNAVEDKEEPLEELLSTAIGENQEIWELRKALFELRGRAPYNQKYSEKFQQIDELLIERVKSILEDKGVEDTKESSELIYSIFEGLVSRKMAGSNKEIDFESYRNKIKEMMAEDD